VWGRRREGRPHYLKKITNTSGEKKGGRGGEKEDVGSIEKLVTNYFLFLGSF